MSKFNMVIKVSSCIFIMQIIYCYFYFNEVTSMTLLSAMALTGGYLLGISMGLTSAINLFGLPNKYLKYRRYFGICGFIFALSYSFFLLVTSPDNYLEDFPFKLFTLANILGVCSMVVLTIMTLLSNNYSIAFLGFKRWKNIMRLGYVAYLSLVLRAALIEGDIWIAWIQAPISLPPPRLLLSIFALIVIVTGLARQIKFKSVHQVSHP